MSEKERLRKAIFEMVKQKKLSLVMAATQCHISYRQASRAYARYLKAGDKGLTHQGRGRTSNRRHPQREAIVERYRTFYEGFGPTLAAEKLAEADGLIVDHDTLRHWLLSEGLWQKQRKRTPHRQRRERRAQFGELVQLDGSIHDWLEEGQLRCLMNMVDDATGRTQARLETGETTAAVFRILWQWIEHYGIPLALYVDLKSVYVSPEPARGFSHVERACARLGIHIQKAYSPQAKGRVERNHGVYQDRFVKELRLKQIKTQTAANEVLASGFIDKLNQKFQQPARNQQDAHRQLHDLDLNQLLCWEYERQVQNDWTFSFEGHCYQLKKSPSLQVKPKQKIIIRRHVDETLSVWFKEQRLTYCCIEKSVNIPRQKTGYDSQQRSLQARANKAKSPWSQFNPGWLKSKKQVNSQSNI